MSLNPSLADWRAEDIADQRRWIIDLTPDHIAELKGALATALAGGASLPTLTTETFPLSAFKSVLQNVRERLEDGLGIAALRGFPALSYTKEDLRLLYWGIGLHTGVAVSQSSKGDFLGDVMDFGQDVYSATGRGYMSSQTLGFHTDTSDVVALMVLRQGKSGGVSRICSALAIRNEIERIRPDLLAVLYEPFFWSWKGQQGKDEPAYYAQPIYSDQDGKFCSRYLKTHILSAYQENDHLPPLTSTQLEAMSLIDTLARETRFHITMAFEPGDIQFLNNHVTYHARTKFEDYPEPDRKRHLLRLWLSVPNSRPLHPSMAAIYRDQRGGAVRGGFPSRTGARTFHTSPAGH